MKSAKRILLAALLALSGLTAGAQIYDTNSDVVGTFAGWGIPGYVDGNGQLTAFSAPTQIVSDTASNLYVWDNGNHVIRKIRPDATVSTLAGGGSFFQGYGTNVNFSWGQAGSMTIDRSNNLWLVLVDGSYYPYISYLLTIGTNGYVEIANAGFTNLGVASGLCADSSGNLYYSGGNRIYRYNPGNGSVQPIAGSGIAANYDGPGPFFSAFNSPAALACDPADNIYVWDSINYTIRRIDPNQNVQTIAGSGSGNYYYGNGIMDGVGTNASFTGVQSIFTDHAGNLYLVCGTCIRKMDAQTNVVTLAGVFPSFSSGNQGIFANGPGNLARFNSASGGCFSQGMVLVADTGNNRIRNITFNSQMQVVPPASLGIGTFAGITIAGTIGRAYQIQSSPDMNTWATRATVLLTSNPYLWFDQNPIAGNNFYRAVMVP